MNLQHALRPAAAALVLAGMVLVQPAIAQQAVPAAPAPAAPAVAPIAPAHLAVAREVVISSGLARSFESYAPQFTDQLKRSILTTRPEIGAQLNEVLAALQPEFDASREEIMGAAARIYAQRMTEAELKDAAAFFKSAAGQRYVTAQPNILDDLFGQMQQWTQKLSEMMVNRVRAELKKRNIEL